MTETSDTTETRIRVVGKGVSIAAVIGLALGIGGVVYQAGLLAADVSSTKAQTQENTADISILKTSVADMTRGNAEISKNVDRILNKLDQLTPSK